MIGLHLPRYNSTLRVSDLDDNDKDDLYMRVQSGLKCYLSDDQGFPTRVQGVALAVSNKQWDVLNDIPLRSADINGNGKDGICARGTATLGYYLSLQIPLLVERK